MAKTYTCSQELFTAAQSVIPGGVNSPVRAFRGVGGTPLFIERGQGALIWDADGNKYIDYVLSWGPLILGHAHPTVTTALTEQATRGVSFGAPTKQETELAERVITLMPHIEQVRFVNSGTEATMSALRLARAYTGRNKIIKFSGCYHGHADMLLVHAGSGMATLGLPDSPGIPISSTANTFIVEYNNLDAVHHLFQKHGTDIAAVIVEPIAANMGFVMPKPGFLKGLRDLTRTHNTVLIFDEVMTGFRASLGGTQALWDIDPDITCLGKVIGGGLPVGAYAGKRTIMQTVAPAGPMYQAGTLSGNPLAMTAGLTTLHQISQPGVFERMVTQTNRLCTGIADLAEEVGLPIQIDHVGTMFGFYFLRSSDRHITNFTEAQNYANVQQYATFFWAMLERGVYMAPSQFEVGFLSAAHRDEEIDTTLTALREVFQLLSQQDITKYHAAVEL